MAYNVLHIAEGGEYEALILKIVRMFNRSTKAELEAAYKEIDRLRGIINYR
jgi:diphthamide synthase (EF-2-diphthine--ammonia ligase)